MSAKYTSTLIVLVAVLALVAGCGGSDDALNQFGAADANVAEIQVVVYDDRIADSDGVAGAFQAVTHTDLTFAITNAGTVPHGVSLYADAAHTLLLVSSPEIEPGASAAVRYHVHDSQTLHLRDDRYPDQLQAVLVVRAPE